MTNDPTADRNDPLRALDAVEPPDRWDDVVSRSTEGELLELAPVAARRSFPRALLAAAAVLAVVALAAGIFAVTRGDDDHQNLATEMPGGRVAAPNIWNSTWELVALERNGEPWDVEPNGETWPELTTTEPGPEAIWYQACNQGSGAAAVEDDRLVATDFIMTAMACLSEGGGTTLMDQEKFVQELLGERPTIAIEVADAESGDGSGAGFDDYGIGDRLTLATANGSATFERTEIGSPVGGGAGTTNPEAIWGRMWEVQSITSGGETEFVALPLDGSPLRLDASTTGRLFFNGCNGAGGEFDLDEGWRLMVIEIGPRTAMGCEQGLMDQDDWLQDFLGAEPTVTVSGDHLTLATDAATIELEAADVVVGQPAGPTDPDDPDGSVSSPPQPSIDPGEPGSVPPERSVVPAAPAASDPDPGASDAAGADT